MKFIHPLLRRIIYVKLIVKFPVHLMERSDSIDKEGRGAYSIAWTAESRSFGQNEDKGTSSLLFNYQFMRYSLITKIVFLQRYRNHDTFPSPDKEEEENAFVSLKSF